jgi:hypothetical protein
MCNERGEENFVDCDSEIVFSRCSDRPDAERRPRRLSRYDFLFVLINFAHFWND